MISADIRKRQAGPGAPREIVLAVAVFALGAAVGFAAYAGVIGPLKEPEAVALGPSLLNWLVRFGYPLVLEGIKVDGSAINSTAVEQRRFGVLTYVDTRTPL